MPDAPHLTAKHPAIAAYYERRKQIAAQGATHELATREAFKTLLFDAAAALKKGWTLITEDRVQGIKRVVRPDGTFHDSNFPRGYWEAKDTADDLDAEIQKKFGRGYPDDNIIFEDTRRAVLYQDGARAAAYDLALPEQVAQLLNRFFDYAKPAVRNFEQAVTIFKQDMPDLSRGLKDLIAGAHKSNKTFQTAYAAFYMLCQNAINPNISRAAVDEMLVQHLLTERLMSSVFNRRDFNRKNVIAAEIETVIDALTSQSFSRDSFLGQLDYFYSAIEAAAATLIHYEERQTFINNVYERFFQGYAINVADTHGIVYTPQPIVEYMGAAVEAALQDEFGLKLGDESVYIIDPCTGTGNFVINLMRRIHAQNPAALPDAYRKRLFANEVMLMPYYIASLNIEHSFMELTKNYEPFDGLCFVDTLDLAEGVQPPLFLTERNTERVVRQRAAPITVIIGNPPYNVGQINENDNNKNRAYPVIDGRVRATYAKDSAATNKKALYDPYVKFFRWASDRLQGRDGIVCYVSNNSFVDQFAFDGMRKHLLQDFTRVYHLDLHGNVRTNPKLSGTTHNVFGIQVGVGVTIAIRSAKHAERTLFYQRLPEFWRKEEKLSFLTNRVKEGVLKSSEWQTPAPDSRHTWVVPENADQFASFIPMGTKAAKRTKQESQAIFKLFSGGVKTNRDEVVYDFNRNALIERVQTFVEDYNAEVDRFRRAGKPKDLDQFVHYEKVKWSRDLKDDLKRGIYAEYAEQKLRAGIYRPFCKKILYFDRVLNEEVYVLHKIFPMLESEQENRIIWLKVGTEVPMYALMANTIVDIMPSGGSQCFPFYTYDPDGSNRRENITDWALGQFQTHYADPAITKWDIFHYTYALLHQPAYRTCYAANLKRDLPRLPYAPDFRALADAGKQLADLHIGYETVTPYPLVYQWKPGKPVDYTVKKMRLSGDKTSVVVNDSLTLTGIPAAAFDYKLGSRSALEWVIDQYQVKTDKRSGITSDPNGYSDDAHYIVKLVGRVVAVSVATAGIVREVLSAEEKTVLSAE